MPSRYAVFGQPISHSLSPRIHAAFGAQFGIAIDYRAIQTGARDFDATLAAFAGDGGRGANVTLPLKEEALARCSTVSDLARRAGSVNTLIRKDDHWHGDSTDGIGLLRDLRERQKVDPAGRRVLLLGAGGAARAAAFALADAGIATLVIANRSIARARALHGALGEDVRVDTCGMNELAALPAFDLIVNATAAGHGDAVVDLPQTLISPTTACYDLSYAKAAQAFVTWARETGAATICDGLGMLVEQAAESFSIWHDPRPDTAPVYADLRAMLATGNNP
jgi:shikimate dehydrogenase